MADEKVSPRSLIEAIKETQEMLHFCSKQNIVSDIEIIPMQQVNESYERVLKSDVLTQIICYLS